MVDNEELLPLGQELFVEIKEMLPGYEISNLAWYQIFTWQRFLSGK